MLQGSSLAQLAYTPDTNALDAYWQRTAAILAQRPEDGDARLELDDDEDHWQAGAGSPPPAQAAAAARRDAIAGPGRLVALQVRNAHCTCCAGGVNRMQGSVHTFPTKQGRLRFAVAACWISCCITCFSINNDEHQ